MGCGRELSLVLLFQQRVQLLHDFEGVGDIDDVGFAARPSAVGVEIDGAALVDEAPSNDMRLFTVTTSGEPLRVTWSGAGLSDLVEVREERENCLVLAALVDERFAAAERSAGFL